jgi:3'-phosphoadenosine 5'-phosphosulfate sulfotransferase (PAPS reductase)/FAD synthetase
MGHAPIYIGISGGKDCQALAYRVQAHLDTIGHAGSRALIHSDLGRVEWRDSISVCERLAERLGWELIVVRRAAGDMMDRWLSRWEANVGRYAALSCVKLIMPWSSAVARFCTSDQKSSVIARAVRARHLSGTVISAVGIRREESTARARAPVAKRDERLTRARGIGLAWNPLFLWPRADVLDYIRSRGDVLHMAYRIYGSSRVSCAFCVLASQGDLLAATRCEDNAAIYREMVDLEIRSTFSFQSKRWLGDVAPALLDARCARRGQGAGNAAASRRGGDSRASPLRSWLAGVHATSAEARQLALVRRRVAEAVGICVDCLEGEMVRARYAALIQQHAQRRHA